MQINSYRAQDIINVLQTDQRFKGNEHAASGLVLELGGNSSVAYTLSEGELALYLVALLIRKLGESQ